MRLSEWLYIFFGGKPPKPQVVKPKNRKLSDVKAGEFITVEYFKALDKIISVKVLNNDPDKKRMLIEFNWKGEGLGRKVFSYSDKIFQDFHLLNSIVVPRIEHKEEDKKDAKSEKESIEEKIREAVEKEDFETVIKLQKELERFNKKS